MLTIRFRMLYFVPLISALLMVFYCAPLPMIQSARVSGRVGMNVAYTSPTLDLDILTRGRCADCSTGYEWRDKKYPEEYTSTMLFRTGIFNRVEVSARVLPYYLDPWIIAGGNIKVALSDNGEEKLFRNIQSALFAGGESTPVEHTPSTSYWGGVLLGTHCPVGENDLELVMAFSGSKYQCSVDYIGLSSLTYTTMNLSVGGIFKPFKRKFIDINAGITGRIPLREDKRFYPSCYLPDHQCIAEIEIEKFIIAPLVVQIGVAVYVPDRR